MHRKDKIHVGAQFTIVFILLFTDANHAKNISGKSKTSPTLQENRYIMIFFNIWSRSLWFLFGKVSTIGCENNCTELTVFFNRSITHLLVFLIVKCTCNTRINNIAILTNFSISYLALTIWILYMVSSDDWENQLTVSE